MNYSTSQIADPLAAGPDKLFQSIQGQDAPLLLLFLINNLGEGDSGKVLFGAIVNDFDVVAVFYHDRDVVKGDVPAGPGVVKLSILIALDYFGPAHKTLLRALTLRVN